MCYFKAKEKSNPTAPQKICKARFTIRELKVYFARCRLPPVKISKTEIFKAKIKINAILYMSLFVTLGFGLLANQALFVIGLNSYLWRGSISALASYLIFIGTCRLWLRLILKESKILKESAIKEPKIEKARVFGHFLEAISYVDSAEAFLLVIPLAISLGILLWIGLAGPELFIDAAFETLVSVGLVRTLRKADLNYLHTYIFKRTLAVFIIYFILAWSVMDFADYSCPGHVRFSTVVKQCWLKSTR